MAVLDGSQWKIIGVLIDRFVMIDRFLMIHALDVRRTYGDFLSGDKDKEKNTIKKCRKLPSGEIICE